MQTNSTVHDTDQKQENAMNNTSNRGSSRKERNRKTMLLFEKIACHPRRAEPLTVSIPCGPGRLRPGQGLVIQQDGLALPLQTRVLARWPDGSAKWLLADFQPDLPDNAAVSLPFAIVETSAAVTPPVAVVRQTPEGIPTPPTLSC